jgi:hypothetical protein
MARVSLIIVFLFMLCHTLKAGQSLSLSLRHKINNSLEQYANVIVIRLKILYSIFQTKTYLPVVLSAASVERDPLYLVIFLFGNVFNGLSRGEAT